MKRKREETVTNLPLVISIRSRRCSLFDTLSVYDFIFNISGGRLLGYSKEISFMPNSITIFTILM